MFHHFLKRCLQKQGAKSNRTLEAVVRSRSFVGQKARIDYAYLAIEGLFQR